VRVPVASFAMRTRELALERIKRSSHRRAHRHLPLRCARASRRIRSSNPLGRRGSADTTCFTRSSGRRRFRRSIRFASPEREWTAAFRAGKLIAAFHGDALPGCGGFVNERRTVAGEGRPHIHNPRRAASHRRACASLVAWFAMRPRVAARSPMSGASLPTTKAAERGRGTLVRSRRAVRLRRLVQERNADCAKHVENSVRDYNCVIGSDQEQSSMLDFTA